MLSLSLNNLFFFAAENLLCTMEFDQYFHYLTKKIVKILCNEDLKPEDLSKNPEDFKVILTRLKNLMSKRERANNDVCKYVCR